MNTTFFTSDSGAVTVDWVVLTAALVGLGLATIGVVSSGVENVSGDTRDQLTQTPIFTTFTQRAYSDYYFALLAHEEAGADYSGADNAAAFFEDMVATFQAMNDTDLATEAAAARDNNIPIFDTRIADLQALNAETVTAADFLTIEPWQSGSQTESDLQTIIDTDFGGDASAYHAERVANQVRKRERFKMAMQVADERGLTY